MDEILSAEQILTRTTSTIEPLPNIVVSAGGSTPSPFTVRAISDGPPPNPKDGDIWIGLAAGLNGENWTFRYNASSTSTYKWEFFSGPPVRTSSDGLVTVTSGTFADFSTVLSLVAIRSGDYVLGCSYGYVAASAAQPHGVSLWANGDEVYAVDNATGTQYDYMGREHRFDGVAAGGTFKSRGYAGGGATLSGAYRELWVYPIRIS